MTELDWLTARPIAHRGLHDDADGRPENSIAAFDYAAAKDIPFEFDVQVTKDGRPVVLHDAELGDALVRDLDWDTIRSREIAPDHPIPTLEQVLETVDGRVPIVVDVRRWGVGGSSGLERAVADRLRDYRGPAVCQSFDPFALRRLRRLLPDIGIGQASGSLRSAGPVTAAIGRMMLTNAITRPDFLTYELPELPARFVTFWRNEKRPLLAYTAHSDDEERRATALADGFFFSGYLPSAYR